LVQLLVWQIDYRESYELTDTVLTLAIVTKFESVFEMQLSEMGVYFL
jgi:hypothetical protein